MTTSESKGRFFLQNESIRIANWNAPAARQPRDQKWRNVLRHRVRLQSAVWTSQRDDGWNSWAADKYSIPHRALSQTDS